MPTCWGGNAPQLDPLRRAADEAAADELREHQKRVVPDADADEAALPSAKNEFTPVTSLPLLWEQLQIFLTIRMAETLFNDVGEYVDCMREDYPDVFTEPRMHTLRDLPQLCLRFPGTKHTHAPLFPLTARIPLVESRVHETRSAFSGSGAKIPRALQEAAFSFAHGRSIKKGDPEIEAAIAEAQGLDGNCQIRGNLFARSTWLGFTLSALDARGFWTDDEVDRSRDQGLFLRMRIRNSRAFRGHPRACAWLDVPSLAELVTFEAQERVEMERSFLEPDEMEQEPLISLSAKRRRFAEDVQRSNLDAATKRRCKRGRGM